MSAASKHASATNYTVTISAGDSVLLDVVDDGVPPDAGNGQRDEIWAQLRQRAEDLDGTLEIGEAEGGGTHLTWSAPL